VSFGSIIFTRRLVGVLVPFGGSGYLLANE